MIKKTQKKPNHIESQCINSSDLTIHGKYSQGSEKLSNRIDMIAKECSLLPVAEEKTEEDLRGKWMRLL